MDSHALEYYSSYSDESPHGHFHRVIMLQEEKGLSWDEVSKMAPKITKGWYELSRVSVKDRIDFTQDYWLAKIPYHPNLEKSLDRFFSSLDDIGIFLTQQSQDDPFEPQMIYSFSDNGGFFHGNAPVTENEIIALQKDFPDYILPLDYTAFLQIHNGFAKLTDTGMMKAAELKQSYYNFQEMIEQQEPIVTSQGVSVNPHSLIPFYKSFGMPFFQCFWAEWYPENEMGNVYYSGLTKTISDCSKPDCDVETMAFKTFTDWLLFYLEKIE